MSNRQSPDRLNSVVKLHIEAFPGFFMTQLGPTFLREYYRCVAGYPGGILLTEDANGECVGFVAGFVDSASFYRALRRLRVRLAAAAAISLLTHPARLLTMLANYRRAGDAENRKPDPKSAELASLAVKPAAHGRGVGSRLVERFIAEARMRGAEEVVLTTDAHENDVANRFYIGLSFTLVRTFKARRNRILNEYSIAVGKV